MACLRWKCGNDLVAFQSIEFNHDFEILFFSPLVNIAGYLVTYIMYRVRY